MQEIRITDGNGSRLDVRRDGPSSFTVRTWLEPGQTEIDLGPVDRQALVSFLADLS